MSTCKTCRFWKRSKDEHEPWEGFCGHVKFVYDEPLPKDGLKYWDYERYSAGFYTGEDFGCIHHSPFAASSEERKP